MNVLQYLNKKGYDSVDGSFYGHIHQWKSWYEGEVKSFHNYKVYNGKTQIRCKRKTLGMGKKVSEDWADLLFNEKVSITLDDQAADMFVSEAFEQNNFTVRMNEGQEKKAALGTVAIVPYLDDVEVDQDGNVVGGGIVKMNYFTAPNIYPLSWENGNITECCFVSYKNYNRKKYAHLQYHELENSADEFQYKIRNEVVDATNGSMKEVTDWSEIPAFAGMVPVIHTGTDEKQFVIDRLNIANNVDQDNPMGISVYANAEDVMQGIDIVYDSYINEFVLGKKRIFVRPDMVSQDMFGTPAFDDKDVVFYQMPEDDGATDQLLKEVDMSLRAVEHQQGLNDNLNIFSTKAGLGEKYYKFDSGNLTTATQVISENSNLYRSICKHEIILESVLKELIRIILRLGNETGASLNVDAEATIKFDDSIIVDSNTEQTIRMQEATGGFISKEQYLMWRYGIDETEAKKMMPQQTDPQFNIPKE
nr:phage portal protein [uncultured Anaerostipes sp.]